MKRQFAVLLSAIIIIAVLGLTYSSQVIADLSVRYPTSVDPTGTKIVLSPSKSSPTSPNTYHLVAQDVQRVVAQRLDQLRLRDYDVVVAQDNQLEVTLPNNDNMPYIINIITRVGEVEFIDGGTGSPPVGQYVKTESLDSVPAEQAYEVLFSGHEISKIIPPGSNEGEIFYQLELQPPAAERFSRFATSKANAYVCLVMDKQVINCSKMYHLSDETLDILPNLSSGSGLSLADLAVFLDSGPLPMSLEVATE